MSLSQYAIQDYSNNNIYYINQSTTINSNLTVPINNYLIIPKDYTLTISPNIIINNSGITFLDIEDIKQDSLSVALSFLIFKLTRHSIYKKKITLKKFRNFFCII